MSDSLITKKAIAGALKTVCKEKAFDKISIADITAACGLNRQTFYYHFQDKYELDVYKRQVFFPPGCHVPNHFHIRNPALGFYDCIQTFRCLRLLITF